MTRAINALCTTNHPTDAVSNLKWSTSIIKAILNGEQIQDPKTDERTKVHNNSGRTQFAATLFLVAERVIPEDGEWLKKEQFFQLKAHNMRNKEMLRDVMKVLYKRGEDLGVIQDENREIFTPF